MAKALSEIRFRLTVWYLRAQLHWLGFKLATVRPRCWLKLTFWLLQGCLLIRIAGVFVVLAEAVSVLPWSRPVVLELTDTATWLNETGAICLDRVRGRNDRRTKRD